MYYVYLKYDVTTTDGEELQAYVMCTRTCSETIAQQRYQKSIAAGHMAEITTEPHAPLPECIRSMKVCDIFNRRTV
jgi:hypothetical protein